MTAILFLGCSRSVPTAPQAARQATPVDTGIYPDPKPPGVP